MTADVERRTEFLDRCLMEADTVEEALAMAIRLETFVTGSAGQATGPATPEPADPPAGGKRGGSRKPLLTANQIPVFVRMAAEGASTAWLSQKFGLTSAQVYGQKNSRRLAIDEYLESKRSTDTSDPAEDNESEDNDPEDPDPEDNGAEDGDTAGRAANGGKLRNCMTCGEKFASEGPHNRMCALCRRTKSE